jgi:dTDP-4-amino-4,6-dideoxygalactose transaminase
MGGGMVTLQDRSVADRVRAACHDEPHNGLRWLLRRLLKTSFEATVTNPLVFNMGVYQALRWAPRGKKGEDRFASGYHGDEVSMRGKMGRYTNYQAKLGLRQMPAAREMNIRRAKNAERLISRLRRRVRFQEPSAPDVVANYMLVTALVPKLAQVSAELLRAGVDTKQRYMRDCSRMFDGTREFTNAARAEREALHLPAHATLSEQQIDRVVAGVESALAGVATQEPA